MSLKTHRELLQLIPCTTPYESVHRNDDGSLYRWPIVAWGLVRDHVDDQHARHQHDGRVHWYQNETVALVVLTDSCGEWGRLGEAHGLIVPASYSDADIERLWGEEWLPKRAAAPTAV